MRDLSNKQKSLRDIAADLARKLDSDASPTPQRPSNKQSTSSKSKNIERPLAQTARDSAAEIAHVTLGEIVLPQLLQTPEVMSALRSAAKQAGIPFMRLRVGAQENSINPNTNLREFNDPQDQRAPSTVIDRFLTGVADPYYGTAQIINKIAGASNSVDQQIVDRENAYDKARTVSGSTGWDFARGVGRLVGSAPIAFALPITAEAALPAALSGAAVGALGSAVEPVPTTSSRQYWLEKAKKTGLGALEGAAKAGGFAGVKSAINSPVDVPNAYERF